MSEYKTWTVILILLSIFIAISVFLFNILTQDQVDEQKQEIVSKLKERGLSRNTTVEISGNGYRFEWIDGKWYRL